MNENEYRVRAVTRYIITHFYDQPMGDGLNKCGSEQFGEFPNIEQADAVGRALQAANPGSTFATIEDRREPRGVFYAHSDEGCERLMRAVGGGSAN
jgi:hypothetical protein